MTTHHFLPATPSDRQELLKVIGAASMEDLLKGIPTECRFQGELTNGPALSELDIRRRLARMGKGSKATQGHLSFIGAGVYERYTPAAINHLTLRGEFLTSYTPYQPELAQGSLQALFEFQTMVAELFGMGVSNASHYDGSTSLAEGALMALRIGKGRQTIAVSAGVHPEYREVLATYLKGVGAELVTIPLNEQGTTSLPALKTLCGDHVAAVLVQSPNFFGVIEDVAACADLAHAAGALLVTSTTEPLALGVLESPGALGADIATGEGQGLGVPASFGGPYVGLFTAKTEFVRQMPGRLCGETVDADGRRSYTLTLSTREQHIRREKATSNICTNQNLIALWASIWLSMVGKVGFQELAAQNHSRSEWLKEALLATGKVNLRYANAPTFNEFVIDLKAKSASEFHAAAVKRGVAPGLALSRFLPEDTQGLLVNVTETKSRENLEALVQLVKELA